MGLKNHLPLQSHNTSKCWMIQFHKVMWKPTGIASLLEFFKTLWQLCKYVGAQNWSLVIKMIIISWIIYLFSHGLRVGDSGTEISVPLQSTIEAGPVVVPVTSVWQTPGDQGAKLFVRSVTWLASSTRTHTTQLSFSTAAILLVMMSVHTIDKQEIKCQPHNLLMSLVVAWQLLTII